MPPLIGIGIPPPFSSGRAVGGGGGFSSLFTLFDGATDSIRCNNPTSILTATDSDKFTLSFAVRPDALTATSWIVHSSTVKFRLKEYAAGQWHFSWKVQGAAGVLCEGHSTTVLVATQLYEIHLAVDFSSGSTTVSLFIDGTTDTPIVDSTDVTGTFTLTGGQYGFAGDKDSVPAAANLLNGCLGQMYFEAGLYDTAVSNYTNGNSPTDWSSLGAPGLLIIDWLDTDVTNGLVNSGTGPNLLSGLAPPGADPTKGTPVICT